jgi:hypothetical protein|tara:strand:+ start:139 stop:474 length:336 start_codon:yes stop_codon:yes gene_type:complete
MNFIKKVSRSFKRVVLGSDSDSDARDDDGRGARAGRRRGRSRATPVVESAVSELSGLAHGGVQGLNWVVAHQRVDEDGDVADGFLMCEEAPARGAEASATPSRKKKRGERR